LEIFHRPKDIPETETETQSRTQTETSQTDSSQKSDSSERAFARGMAQDDEIEKVEKAGRNANELALCKLKEILGKEVVHFLSLINSEEFQEKKMSTSQFWLKNQKEMPHLFDLALVLNCIICSAATIERFFSICGAICKQRHAKIFLFSILFQIYKSFKLYF
jgi:hypothetical protein